MNIIYDCRWSDRVDEKFIQDFNTVKVNVFHGEYSVEEFKRQLVDNIYGRSVVVVVYMDNKPVAARALWRNDIGVIEAYQPGQTCVTEICRGQGIFTEMTRRSIQMLSPQAIIYNFPNKNSYPGYIKMGWQLVGEYRPRVLFSIKQYEREHLLDIDEKYVRWWILNRAGIKYVMFRGQYFLCRKDTPRPFVHIIGRTTKNAALLFPRVDGHVLCFYNSTKKTFYNKNYSPLRVVSKGEIEKIYIPTWKLDVL